MLNYDRKDIEGRGVDLSMPYDHRDWDAIMDWAEALAAMAKGPRS